MLALLLALASPELDVRGISVSYGNTVVENAFRNAVAILRRAGKRTTLAVGARRPLKRPLAVARDTHGESGLGYAELPPAGVILDFVKSLEDRKSTRLNSSHLVISYAVFCLKKKKSELLSRPPPYTTTHAR